MKTGSLLFLFVLFLLPPDLLLAKEEARIWTDRDGRTVAARFVEVSGSTVVLELENGARSRVPVTTLSLEDQTLVASLRDKRPLVWPETVTVDTETLTVREGEQDAENRQHHYETDNFEFISNAPLTGRVVAEVAADLELIDAAFQALPWDWEPRSEESDLFKMYLAETEEDFIALGGTDNTSGGSRDDYAFVKFSAVGLRTLGSRYSFDPSRKEPGRVVSLGARLMTGEMRSLLKPWSARGMENFLRRVSYRSGGFHFAGLETAIKREIKLDSDRGVSLDLDRLVARLRADWGDENYRGVRQALAESHFDSMVLFYYFGYLDGDGSGEALHRYYRDVARERLVWRAYRESSGKTERPRPRDDSGSWPEWGTEHLDGLLDGRSDEELKAEIDAKFRAMGIRFE
ncbi:MAG: SHD1 domain-containing protein [Verrucomicrobiales bacterium]